MEHAIPVLVDRRNYDQIKDEIIAGMKTAPVIGFDLETQNEEAHDGVKEFRKSDTAKVFDWRKMIVTGASIYADGAKNSYYFNIAHADEENRLTFAELKYILDQKPDNVCWICHNAPFEITVMKNSHDYDLKSVIDTMQMAVSAYGPDEYDRNKFVGANFGAIQDLFQDASRAFAGYDMFEDRGRRTPEQDDLLFKVLGKASNAAYSYNGFISTLAYGYGLKKAVKSFFDYDMKTYEQTLNGKAHMGELTGEETCDYGADDSYWAVKLFYKLFEHMQNNCPEAIQTFFDQENPMIHVFSQIKRDGLRVNKPAIEARRTIERAAFAQTLRDLKATVRALLPFPDDLNERLAKYDKWYAKDAGKYRQRLADWANLPDSQDDFTQACQVSSAVSNAWAGAKTKTALSIGHYYQSRLLMYDLTHIPAIIYKGKVSSDAECRGEIRDKIRKLSAEANGNDAEIARLKNCDKLIELLGTIAGIEQRMKLYLNPYLLLTDPETGRMYPEISSLLATRRMAGSNPNPMQLAKRGESTYVRGFYLADTDDEVLVSLDWSQIELVLIGEFSGDPQFAEAYGQLPYKDLHLGAAADVLSVVIDGVTAELLKNLGRTPVQDIPPKLLIKPNGEPLDPGKASKYWRTEVGKGSNFNYWYSGALSTVGEKLGWTSDQMWAATEAYRTRFAVGEAWRVKTIEDARWSGYVMLPDGHRRVRWEATYEWSSIAQRMFEGYGDAGVIAFGREVIKAIKTRAGNQLVNALIQGSSATLAKRSIVRINKALAESGLRARFKLPIHDELVFSVHRDDVVAFIKLAKSIMTNHPEVIKNLKVYATASVGLTFEPFDAKKAPFGQIELDEAPEILDFQPGAVLDDKQIERTIDYLFQQRRDHAKDKIAA